MARRLSTFKQLLRYMWDNKLWWMIPIILVLLLAFVLILVGQSAVPVFIYPL